MTTDDLSFDEWCEKVNLEIISLVGLGKDDIDDWHYRNAFDSGMTPEETARDALENAGYPCGGLDSTSMETM